MKQPRKLHRNEKEILSSHGFKANDWMLKKKTEFHLYLVNKKTGKSEIVDNFKRR